jgi:hypothetical protein
MNEAMQQEDSGSEDEFQEQRRRKRNPSDEQIQAKRISISAITRDPKALPRVAVRNFFAPLRKKMETEDRSYGKGSSSDEAQQKSANQAGRLPPIIPTSATNLL